MRGQILGVDTRTGEGLVAGDDGRRYAFAQADWAARGEPAIGLLVDFETADNRALSVFPVPGTAPPAPVMHHGAATGGDRNKYVAALLAFLIGTLGLHRFYLGRTASAITMLVLSCTLLGLVVTIPWALVDTLRYLMMSDREFESRYPG